MHVTVYGAGAIGGSLGAFLVREGENVQFVDKNEEHVAQMNTRGLRVDGSCEEFVVDVKALTPKELTEGLDVVLLAVKSHDTEDAVRQFVHLLSPESTVISLQNGLNEEKIAGLVGTHRTIGAFVHLPADYVAPGHIRLGGEGSIYIGELNGTVTPRIERLQQVLNKALPVKVSTNIMGALWSKQVYAPLLFATALVDLPVDAVVGTPEFQKVLGDLVREAMEVPAVLGIPVTAFDEFDPELFKTHCDAKAMGRIAAQFSGQIKNKTGVWRDLAVRKRKTEVDGMVGATVEKGECLGLSLPLNRRLVELIHDLEEGRRTMSIENLRDLAATGAS